ncbi:MAG: YHS domain-containing (seleno)protein [Verrucomicrobiota bacterium]
MKTVTLLNSENYLLKLLSVVALVFGLGAVPAANAQSSVNTGLFNNTAIKGYDPVAYFVEAKPVKGSKKHRVEWNGANWHFASEANKAAFEADPEAYAPQFGGFCAWAVSQGYTAGIDPDAWDIVDGKLYLNYSKSVQATWSEDRANLIEKANQNWPEILEK